MCDDEHPFTPTPSPSTVDEARQRVIDAAPIWEDVDTALDALLAAVRREEQQAAEAREEAAEERADRWAERSFAVEAARARAEQAERADDLHVIAIEWKARAEQAEAQYAVAEAERVDSASLIQCVMKIVGDADGSGIETDEELLEALGRVEARVQGLTDALRGFVDVRPPSMEHPYAPTDYDEWRILRKDARAALAAKRVGRQNKRMKVESPAPAPRAHEENT